MKLRHLILIGSIASAMSLASIAQAQAPVPPDPQHSTHAGTPAPGVEAQLADLRVKIARLEALLSQKAGQAGMSGMSAGGGMKMMEMGGMKGGSQAGGGMGMMDMDMMGMGGMKGGSQAGGGMGMMDMDMMGMGGMKGGSQAGGGMGKMGMDTMMGMNAMGTAPSTASALPGFAGRSHLYHIGSTGFFLNHSEHITLSTEQTARLNGIRETAMLSKANTDRAVAQAEQELWKLTAAGQPEAAQIESRIREIEKLRGDQRLAFIRSVGEAAQILTEQQREVLSGTATADSPAKPADPHAGHKPAKP